MAAFRPDIQALRAVAVLLVVAYHVWPTRMHGGYVGVDVFFVISGYLITGHLAREVAATGRINLPGFYARRARRLLPAAGLTLVMVGLASYRWMPSWTWVTIAADIAASTFFAENWVLIHRAVDYQAQNEAPSPLKHFWSLAVEEQFYFGWPLLVAGVAWVWRWRAGDGHQSKKKNVAAFSALQPPGSSCSSPPLALKAMGTAASSSPSSLRPPSRAWYALPMAAACTASFATALVYAHSRPEVGYFTTHSRLYELGMGGLLAVLADGAPDTVDDFPCSRLGTWPRTAAALAGLAAIGTSAALFTARTPFPGAAALLPTLGAGALLWAGDHQPEHGNGASAHALVPFMSHPWLQYIGDTSYSLYLAHWPVVVIYPFATGRAVEGALADGVLVCVISFVLAHACKRWWEDRFLPGDRRCQQPHLHLDPAAVCEPDSYLAFSASRPRRSTLSIVSSSVGIEMHDGSKISGSDAVPCTNDPLAFACCASPRRRHLNKDRIALVLIVAMTALNSFVAGALLIAEPTSGTNFIKNAENFEMPFDDALTSAKSIDNSTVGAQRQHIPECTDFFGPNASYPYPGADAALKKCSKLNSLSLERLASLGTASARIQGKYYPNPPLPGSVTLHSARRRVVVLGDSHGGRWNAAFGIVGRRLGLNVTNLYKSSCAPSLVRLEGQTQECQAWNAASVARVLRARPDAVIMIAYKRRTPEKWIINATLAADGLAQVAKKIVSAGIPVLYIKSTPHMPQHVPNCLAQEAKRNATGTDLSACSISREDGVQDGIMELAARKYPLMQRMSFDDVFCPGVTCPPVIGNVIVYTDAHHMSPAFSKSLASALQYKLLEVAPHLWG